MAIPRSDRRERGAKLVRIRFESTSAPNVISRRKSEIRARDWRYRERLEAACVGWDGNLALV
jgi:hypothetical protein